VEELFDWILYISDVDKCTIKEGVIIKSLYYFIQINSITQNIFISNCKKGGKSINLYNFVLVRGTRKIMY